MLEGMSSPSYVAYLEGAGIEAAAIAGREVWDAQIQQLYADARRAMIALGIVQP